MSSLRSSLLVTSLACSIVLAAQVTIADAGPDQYLCSSNAFLQGNTVAVGEVGTWSIVSGLADIGNIQDPSTQITATGFGVIVFRWSIQGSDSASSDDVAIWVYDGNAPDAYAGEDIVVQVPQTNVVVQAGPFSWPTTCVWTVVMGSGTIGDPTEAITMYAGATVGLNVLQWSCDNGPCGITTDDVVITVEEALALGWIPAIAGVHAVFEPGTERLSIIAPRNIDRVLITDHMGRVVLDRSMSVRSASLDVSQLLIGTYVVRAMMDDTPFTERFVLVR